MCGQVCVPVVSIMGPGDGTQNVRLGRGYPY